MTLNTIPLELVRPERMLSGPGCRQAQAPAAQPRLSVIVPAHNAAQRLPRALRSALSQSIADIEVIVVDDASSDPTSQAVEAIGRRDPRVRLIRSERNRGPGGARNLALEAARGEWIALLDSDDVFLPSRLSRLLRHAVRGNADLVADNLLLRDHGSSGTVRAMLPPSLLDRPLWLDPVAFLRGNLPIPGHPRVSYGFLKPIVRRAFLERHALTYRNGLRFAEDFDFYLRCLLAGGRWLLIPEAGYAYSVRADSLTARHGAAELIRLRALDRSYLEGRPARSRDPALDAALVAHLRAVEDRLVWRLVLTALKHGRLRRARRLALRSPHDCRVVVRALLAESPRQVVRQIRSWIRARA